MVMLRFKLKGDDASTHLDLYIEIHIKSIFGCMVTALPLRNFYRSELNYADSRRVVVRFKQTYVHELLLTA